MKNKKVLSSGIMKVAPKSTKKKRRNVDSQERGEKLPQYDHSKIQEMIYDMEKKFNRNFPNDFEVV